MRTAAYTDLQIIHAVNELKADGKKVTPYTVIARLGGGASVPYISKTLTRLARSGSVQIDNIADEDDAILQDIKRLLDKNRAEAQVNAHKEYQSFKSRFETVNLDLREKNKKLEFDNNNLGNQLADLNEQIKNQQKLISEQNQKINELTISNARIDEQLKNSNQSLSKIEAKAESYLKMLNDAHDKHQQERLELLSKLNEITVSSQVNIQSAQRAEQTMRKQLEQAMKDGLIHTTTISKLRDELRAAEGGKAILKKYGTWDKVATLCKNSGLRKT